MCKFKVYNFMAIQESRVNQRLADESKRIADQSYQIAAAARKDSSAMFGIALLTMFFLPATFISVSPGAASS